MQMPGGMRVYNHCTLSKKQLQAWMQRLQHSKVYLRLYCSDANWSLAAKVTLENHPFQTNTKKLQQGCQPWQRPLQAWQINTSVPHIAFRYVCLVRICATWTWVTSHSGFYSTFYILTGCTQNHTWWKIKLNAKQYLCFYTEKLIYL